MKGTVTSRAPKISNQATTRESSEASDAPLLTAREMSRVACVSGLVPSVASARAMSRARGSSLVLFPGARVLPFSSCQLDVVVILCSWRREHARGIFAFAPRRASRARASSSDVSSVGDPTAVAGDADAVSSPSAGSAPDVDSLVRDVLLTIADTDSGRDITDAQRDATDANIAALERIGATQRPVALENPLIFGDYDVSYVSTGKKQIGNPAGGRSRGGLGAALFRTQGLEQNLYEPNVVVNRVAFLVLGLIPGEVVLNGTFVPLTAELVDENAAVVDEETKNRRAGDASRVTANERSGKGVDDGMTVRAFFDPPEITLGGLPTFRVGPKSSVVLSTACLDHRVRLGKGSRGSLFVFTRKTAEQAERDRRRWRVGGLGVTVMLSCAMALLAFAVRRFRAGGATELTLATAAAVAVSLAMALVMRQGGIVAEDADYDEKYEAAAEKARAAAAKGGEGTLG